MHKSFKYYIVVIFINAFVDLGYKVTIQNIILRSFDVKTQIILSAVLGAFLVLPFVAFFSVCGYLSDRYSKASVMKYSAFAIFILSICNIALFATGNFWALYFATLLYALQAAIFSPSKYGYIREFASKSDILKINAFVQAFTTAAMIGAGVVFSIFFEYFVPSEIYDDAKIVQLLMPVGIFIICLTLTQTLFAFKIQTIGSSNPQTFSYAKLFKLDYLKQNLQFITFWRIVFSIAAFWALAQVISAVFPAFARDSVGIISTVVIQEKLAMIVIGMILGSIYCAKIDRGFINLGLASLGAFGMAICVLLITYFHHSLALTILFLIFGFFGSCFIVPLNAYIQYNTEEAAIGRVVAGVNFIQSIAMIFALCLTAALAFLGLNGAEIFWICGILMFFVGFLVAKEPIKDMTRFILSAIFSLRYNIKNIGELPKTDNGMLLIGNHISWIDWAILQIVYPKRIYFIMDDEIFSKKIWNKILRFFDVIPISTKPSKQTFIQIRELLKSGKHVCIFPEGEISKTGELGEFKRGFKLILKDAALAHINVVPFYIDGLQGSVFSYCKQNANKTHLRRNVYVYFGASISNLTDAKSSVEMLRFKD